MKSEDAIIIATETKESYDAMAKEFSDSRARFWDELAFLANHIHHDDRVLDVGCGNGRFIPLVVSKHAHYTGVDYSRGLIEEAMKNSPNGTFVQGDATALPFPEQSFDIAYSFAVIHHIPSEVMRRKFAEEIFRVIHPGGTLILTTWNLWSRKYFIKLVRSAVDTILRKNSLDVGDVMLTFGKRKHPRYIHAFTIRELRILFEDVGWSIVTIDTISRKSGEKNIVLVAQKPL